MSAARSTSATAKSTSMEVLSPDGKEVRFNPSVELLPLRDTNARGSPAHVQLPSLPRKDHCCTGTSAKPPQVTLDEQPTSSSDESSSDNEDQMDLPTQSTSHKLPSSQSEQDVLHEAEVGLVLEDLACTEEGKAPFELIAEFLKCVMEEKYEAAKVLCEYIVRLEPENAAARDFYPVLIQKIQIENALESESESSSEESESSSDTSSEENSSDGTEEEQNGDISAPN